MREWLRGVCSSEGCWAAAATALKKKGVTDDLKRRASDDELRPGLKRKSASLSLKPADVHSYEQHGLSEEPLFEPSLMWNCERNSTDSCAYGSESSLSVPLSLTRQLSRVAAGHQGRVLKEMTECSKENGYILKELDQAELEIYELLAASPDDTLHPFLPDFGGETVVLAEDELLENADGAAEHEPLPPCLQRTSSCGRSEGTEGKRYLRLANILADFQSPYVMDIKVGVRSFMEKEAKSTAQRKDLYEKLLRFDPDALLPEERGSQTMTKCRYMSYRDSKSSSSSLGFRIDGIAGPVALRLSSSSFQTVCTKEQVVQELLSFVPPPRKFRGLDLSPNSRLYTKIHRFNDFDNDDFLEAMRDSPKEVDDKIIIVRLFVEELFRLRTALEQSLFFRAHEFVGTSLLFVVDVEPIKVRIVMIDFAKVQVLKNGTTINHRDPWVMGNHEDRFLFGVDRCIECWQRVGEIFAAEAAEMALKPVLADSGDESE